MKKHYNIEGYERIKIGTHIRKWRNIRDIKQKDLAKALRVSEAAISNMENDLTDITLSQIEDVSIALNVPFEDLFTDPQTTIDKYGGQYKEVKASEVMEKDLLYTILGSIQKKDQELEIWMQKMIQTLEQNNGKQIKKQKPLSSIV